MSKNLLFPHPVTWPSSSNQPPRHKRTARIAVILFTTVAVAAIPLTALAIDFAPPSLSNFVADRSISGLRTFSVDETDTDNNISCSLYSGSPGSLYGAMSRVPGTTNTFSVSNVPVGAATWTWEARCTDTAGNVGSLIKSFTFHTPAVDSISYDVLKAGMRTITATAPDFNSSPSTKESCTVYVDGSNKGIAFETSVNSGVFTNAVIPILTGSRTVKVYCVNSANQSAFKEQTWVFPAPIVGTVTVDSQTTGARTFSTVSPDFNTNSATPQSCTLYLDTVNAGPMIETGNNTNTFTLSEVQIGAGSHTAKASCTDEVGNTGTDTLSWTTVAPVISSMEATRPSGRGTAWDFIAQAQGMSYCKLTLDGADKSFLFNTPVGSATYTRNETVTGEVLHTAIATCFVSAGGASAQKTVTFTPDYTPPVMGELKVDTLTPGARTFIVSASDTRDSTLTCKLLQDSNALVTMVKTAGTTNYVSQLPITAGEHSFQADCNDGAQNTSFQSATWTFTTTPAVTPSIPPGSQPVDTEKPVVSAISTSGLSTGAQTITVMASDNISTNLDCSLYMNSVLLGSMSKTSGMTYTRRNVTLVAGQNNAFVQCTDDMGNMGTQLSTFTASAQAVTNPPSGGTSDATSSGLGSSSNTTSVTSVQTTSGTSIQTPVNTTSAGDASKRSENTPVGTVSDTVQNVLDASPQPNASTTSQSKNTPSAPNIPPWLWTGVGILLVGGLGVYALKFLRR